MKDTLLGFLIGSLLSSMFTIYSLKDFVQIYEVDGIKTIHTKGHLYKLVEIDRSK